MFFNLNDKEIKSLTTDSADVGTSYSLQMTLDLSKLDDKVYLLPTDITAVHPLSEKKDLLFVLYSARSFTERTGV